MSVLGQEKQKHKASREPAIKHEAKRRRVLLPLKTRAWMTNEMMPDSVDFTAGTTALMMELAEVARQERRVGKYFDGRMINVGGLDRQTLIRQHAAELLIDGITEAQYNALGPKRYEWFKRHIGCDPALCRATKQYDEFDERCFVALAVYQDRESIEEINRARYEHMVRPITVDLLDKVPLEFLGGVFGDHPDTSRVGDALDIEFGSYDMSKRFQFLCENAVELAALLEDD